LNEKEDKCIASTIKNCAWEVFYDNHHMCISCLEGMSPDKSHENCVTGAVKNCLWGGNSGGDMNCQRCIDGYTISPMGGPCVISQIKGCMNNYHGMKICDACNSYEGYFAESQSVCRKY
jgi:hypothetical protein